MADESVPVQPLEQVRDILLESDTLIERISPVIAEVLTEQIAQSRDEIAQALAPVIGEALRRQVYQARDDIVDALYPVIGQAISKAIAEAMRDLAQTLDARVRATMRPQDAARRWVAQLRGIPAAEFTLRAALPFVVREIFLIQREAGLLIYHQHFTAERAPAERDVVSGMLTAIRDFARDAFGRGAAGDLGAIEYAARRILIEAGGAVYLAVVIDGVEPTGFRETMRQTLTAIQDEQYARLKNFDGTDDKLIKNIARKLEAWRAPLPPRAEPRKPLARAQRFAIGALIALIVLMPLALCGGWIWRVESLFIALAATPTPSPTATATTTPTFTLTPTFTPTITATPTLAPVFGVMTANAYLREAPGSDSAGRPIVTQDARVQVLAQFGEWYWVRATLPQATASGWVPTRWVILSQPLPAAWITPNAQ